MTQPSSNETSKWKSGLSDEIQFWESFLATGGAEWSEQLKQRLDPHFPLNPEHARFLDPSSRGPLEILDVGAGPLTCLGKTLPHCTLRITAVDPLAGEYDAMLAKHGIVPPVRTMTGQAETLAAQFGENRFDMVFSRNALDHSADPLAGIRQCLLTVKPGCYVVLMHFLNEAKLQNYQGLHQWNFDWRDGQFIIWNPRQEINVAANVADLCTQIICENPRPRLLVVALRKTA